MLRSLIRSPIRPMVGSVMGGASDVRPATREMAAIGDSITAQGHAVNGAGDVQCDARGWIWWARTLSRQRIYFPASNNKGTGGNTTAQMLARITDVTGLSAKLVAILGGTNDAASSVSASTTISNLQAMIAACRAVGQVVILIVPQPRDAATGGLTSGQVAELKLVRDWCRLQNKPAAGVYVADAWNDLAASADSETPASGMLRDGVHPTPKGSSWIGYRVKTILETLYGQSDPWDVDGSSLCATPDLAGTGGSKSGGATGDVATNWVFSSDTLSGDQAIVASKVSSGGKTWQQFVISGDFSGGAKDASCSQTLPNWGVDFNVGDTISFAIDYEVDTPASIRHITARLLYKSGATMNDGAQTTEVYPSDSRSGVIRIQRYTFPVGATRCTPQFGFTTLASAGVSATIRFARAHLIKH